MDVLKGLAICLYLCLPSIAQEVHLPPYITYENEERVFNVREDGQVELYCEAEGAPAPEYEWKKDGKLLDLNSEYIEQIPNGIRIVNFYYEYAGQYQCFASNDYGTTMTNKYKVMLSYIAGYPANDPTTPHIVTEGDPLKMICKKVKSKPEDNTRKDWATVLNRDSSDYTDIILDRRIQQDDLGNLVFSHVTKDDEKDGYLYQCKVTNAVAAISTFGSWSTITVVEANPPVDYKPPKMQYYTGQDSGGTVIALKREATSLKCLFAGKPPPENSWSRVGEDMDFSRMVTSEYKTILTITDVQDSDEGQYKCTGTNQQKRSTDSQIINVDVQAKPFFERPNTMPVNHNATEGDDVIIRCDPDAEPPAEVTWMMNGKELTDENLASKASFIEEGRGLLIEGVCKDCSDSDLKVYQCYAENVHGSVFASAYLNVLKPSLLTEHHENITLEYNKEVTFKCDGTTDASTPATFSWLLNDRRIDYIEDRIWLEEDGRILKLKTKNLGEEVLDYIGNYTCIIHNGYSQDNWTAALSKPPAEPPAVIEGGFDLWWVIVIVVVVLLLLLLLLLICCCLRRNRGDVYPVDEKERANGNDPAKELLDEGFQDYQRPEEGPVKGSRASLSSTAKLDDDDASLAEYDDIDTGKFNEDGSFIGLYSTADRKKAGKV